MAYKRTDYSDPLTRHLDLKERSQVIRDLLKVCIGLIHMVTNGFIYLNKSPIEMIEINSLPSVHPSSTSLQCLFLMNMKYRAITSQ